MVFFNPGNIALPPPNIQLIRLFIFIIGMLSVLAKADTLDLSKPHNNISTSVLYLEDAEGLKTADGIFLLDDAAFQQMHQSESINFGFTQSAYWLKLKVNNSADEEAEGLLEVGYAILDDVTFFVRKDNSDIEIYHTGDNRQFAQRPYPHSTFVLPLSLTGKQKAEVLVRIKSSSSVQAPIFLWHPNDFTEHSLKQYLGIGLYLGCLIGLAAYHLILGLSLRDRRHTLFTAYAISTAALISSLEGLSYQYLWPEAVRWNHISIVFSMGCIYIFGGLFALDFLRLRDTLCRARLTYAFIGCSVFVVLSSLILPYALTIKLALIDSLFGFALTLWLGISRAREGDAAARYFSASFAFLMISGLLLIGNKIGLLPRTTITENALMVGSALQAILLSLALTERTNRDKQQRIAAQLATLTEERELIEQQQLAIISERKENEAQKNELAQQRRANEILEQKVEKRTAALEEANKKLTEIATMDSLTGVRNRKYLDEVFHSECKRAQRHHTSLSVMLIEMDNFTAINEEYGNVIGDRCLISLARQLKKSSSRASDVIARYGSIEFCILLPNTPHKDAAELAETICRNVANLTCNVNNFSIKFTVSLGIASSIPNTVADGFHLIDQAAKALRSSSAAGGNRATSWSAMSGAQDKRN
jgi:diguanylate cyclase (GGDEF)-like protein